MLKKFTLFAIAIVGCITLHAQTTVFSENFDEVDAAPAADLPDGWNTYDEDGLTPANSQIPQLTEGTWKVINLTGIGKIAISTSWYSPAGQSDDWMVSPQITVPATNGFLFYDVMAPDQTYPDDYELRISTTGNTPADFTDAPVYSETSPPGSMTMRVISLADYAGQDIYIAWRNVANDEFLLYVDNISVQQLPDYEAGLMSIDVPHLQEAGSTAVTATFENNGAQDITSFDASWQVDGGDLHTQSFDGVNVSTNGEYTFSFDDQLTLEAGTDYNLTVTISNFSGQGDDENVSDNTSTRLISVASSTVQRKPLYEEFTSSTCGPCQYYNSTLYTPFFSTVESDSYSLIKYQVNWPETGDPYYTDECGTRVSYYGINAAPTLLLGGEPEEAQSSGAMQNNFDSRNATSAYFDLSVDADFTDPNVTITVNTTPYVSGDFTLYAAVIENETTQNATTNGETSFEHVMMKMVPDANGTTISVTGGETLQTSLATVNMSSTNMEEFSDLAVVVFLQDPETKEILQSEHVSNTLSVENKELANLKMYPNPSNGVLHISSENPVDVQINDVTGKYVFAQDNVSSNQALDISNLKSGIYFVTMKQESAVTTKKLVIE